jgi:hypothetical protein
VLGQLAALETHDIDHDPVRRLAYAAKPAVEQHVVAIGDGKPVLIVETFGEPFDQGEESLASGRNVRAVLNVVRRPETLRGGLVPLVNIGSKGDDDLPELAAVFQIAVHVHHVVELECTIDDRLERAARKALDDVLHCDLPA